MYNDYMSLINTSGPNNSYVSVPSPLVSTLNNTGIDALSHPASMNFRIHKAVGGFVLEVINYSSSEYVPKSKLYVADETNLGSQIEKIFLLESIKGN